MSGGDYRFDIVAQEQLAAQIVAVMNAHFSRPENSEKLRILDLAKEQIYASELMRHDAQSVYAK